MSLKRYPFLVKENFDFTRVSTQGGGDSFSEALEKLLYRFCVMHYGYYFGYADTDKLKKIWHHVSAKDTKYQKHAKIFAYIRAARGAGAHFPAAAHWDDLPSLRKWQTNTLLSPGSMGGIRLLLRVWNQRHMFIEYTHPHTQETIQVYPTGRLHTLGPES